jgi:hypothetical protein
MQEKSAGFDFLELITEDGRFEKKVWAKTADL